MNNQKTVLLVEDNKEILDFNKDALLMEGYRALTAETLNEAARALARESVDLILLDVNLPDGSGLDFIERVRETSDVPVIFLTGRTDKTDLLDGLTRGGCDYITKPYDIDELLARIAAQLRGTKPPKTITLGPLTLDMRALRAYMNGEDLSLAQREFALLSLLVQNEGKTLTKEYLYETAWGQPMAGDAGALQTQISLLKKRLEEKSGGEITLLSVRGEGYSLEIA